ncbi:MAG: hypothetical protein MSC30_20370 [Gaiellaceae bacterium MAG52_C11]|nr:hypothetical protein [Candidatus Gaiellasilicea maunaloa]
MRKLFSEPLRFVRRPSGRLAALVVLGAALAPASAAAATVEFVPPTSGGSKPDLGSPASVRFQASPGEANVLSAEVDSAANEIVVTDSGATITTDRECRNVDMHTVRCPALSMSADTGDGEDRIVRASGIYAADLGPGNDRVDEPIAFLTGGDGDDALIGQRVSGGSGADLLVGGLGDDHLDGGLGPDHMFGGPGEDDLSGADWAGPGTAQPADDLMNGGDGKDTVVYAPRRLDVSVDLSNAAPGGSAGEQDSLVDIERVVGGAGDDTLTGDSEDNRLAGAGGNDELIGGGGDDRLGGDGGRDRLDGGPGSDEIYARVGGYRISGSLSYPTGANDPREEHVACGPGTDLVADGGGFDVLEPDCEAISRTFGISYPRRSGPRAISLSVVCPGFASFRRECPVRVSLKAASQSCDRGSARERVVRRTLPPRRGSRLRLGLPRGCRHGRLRISLRFRDEFGDPLRLGFVVPRLRRQRTTRIAGRAAGSPGARTVSRRRPGFPRGR